MIVARRYRFCASHRLHRSGLSEEQNYELFGKCNNPFGHGHNYVVEVAVEGEVEPESGSVVDVAVLDRLVQSAILSRYDHRYLNEELEEFQTTVPTTENLGRDAFARLNAAWQGESRLGEPVPTARLKWIRISETDRNIFEFESL